MARRSRKQRRGARPTPGAAAPRYTVTVPTRALTRVLLIVALALLAAHAALSLCHYRLHEVHWLVRQLFDVDQENNLPTWFSGFLLLVASALLWLRASAARGRAGGGSGYWTALAVGFLLLSVDEVAGVHESINSAIVMTWAIPGGIAAVGIGLAFVPFLLRLPRRTAVLFVLAGAMYVAGGAGIEIIGNSLVGQRLRDTLQYNLWTLAEESLEMLGVILFLDTLLREMRGPGAGGVPASVEIR